ncbi:MAG: T9SS type A sorting domain-containing protein [Sphingobacteriales bacterium]|nr:MAG: T9SS type A sorting domain-containing protein [Sphingobacteriales bacterium]
MSKKLLQAALLCSALGTVSTALAQNPATQPEFQLPTVMGPVVRPQNASASTMQNITGPSGGTENLYIHSWDVYASYDNNGIAWRRTDAAGNLIAEDHIILNYAEDIDAVIYSEGSDFFVLAAYYYRNNITGVLGHYYDIYRFEAGGLMPVSTMNFLSASPAFGRINVDASYFGLAIIWCVPGTGIYTKVADLGSGSGFGPDVLLPGTANNVDPDICIRRGYGGSNTGADLQMAFLENNLTVAREYRIPFFNVLAGATSGYVQEMTASSVGPKYFPPRIDCPDRWGTGQKWVMVLGAQDISGGTVTEWVSAMVKNEDWPGVPPTYTYPTPVDISYATYPYQGWPEPIDPVVTYDKSGEVITVGWISQQSTSVLPGYNKKYLAKDIRDDGSAAPAVIPGSFNMISNAPASGEAVLAFSGENLNSDFDGLYIAFSKNHPAFPNYCMNYKSRPFGMSTFKDNASIKLDTDQSFTVAPNPFANQLSFVAPAAGNYTISITSVDGRTVYTHKDILSSGQLFQVNTQGMASGTYLMHIISQENDIKKTEKLTKL